MTQLKVKTRGKDLGRDIFSVKGSKKRVAGLSLLARRITLKSLVNLNCSLIQSFLPNKTNPSLVSNALSISLENSLDSIIFHSSRTIIRSRCSRLTASSFEYNVCKGSRQTGSVRSQEGVAHEFEEVGAFE